MSTWDSAYLLQSFNRKAGRPSTDDITDASKYQRLSDAQNRIVALLQAVAPESLYPKVGYGSLPTLTTTDHQVFTFGTDPSGYALFPMGKGGIYASLNDIPGAPWRPGVDYILEGTQIRIPNNGTWSGPLYWYGVTAPPDITAIVQPSLFPEAARELIVIEAVRQFSQEYLRNPALTDEMLNEFDTRAWPTWTLTWKTQFRAGGALDWWTGYQYNNPEFTA